VDQEEFGEPWIYRVFIRNGTPIMSVVVGSAGIYEKEVNLSNDQYISFKKDRVSARKFAETISNSTL